MKRLNLYFDLKCKNCGSNDVELEYISDDINYQHPEESYHSNLKITCKNCYNYWEPDDN